MTERSLSTLLVTVLATSVSMACGGTDDVPDTCVGACHHLIDDCYSQVSMPTTSYDEASCEADCANPITWCDAGAIYACVAHLDCNHGHVDLASCFTDPGCTIIADAGLVQAEFEGGGMIELAPEPPEQLCIYPDIPELDVAMLRPGFYTTQGPSDLFIAGTSFNDGGSITVLANDGMNIAGTFEVYVLPFDNAGACLLRGSFDVPATPPVSGTPACSCDCPPPPPTNESCSSGGGAIDPFLLSALAILGLRARRRRALR